MSEPYHVIRQRAEFFAAQDRKAKNAHDAASSFLTWKAMMERDAQKAEDNNLGASHRITSFLDVESSTALPPCSRPAQKPISPSSTGWGGFGDPGFGE